MINIRWRVKPTLAMVLMVSLAGAAVLPLQGIAGAVAGESSNIDQGQAVRDDAFKYIAAQDSHGATCMNELLSIYQVESLSELDDTVSVVITYESSSVDIADNNKLQSKADKIGLDLKINHSYSQVLLGHSIQVPRRDLEKVFSLPGVKKVHPVGTVEAAGHNVFPQMGVESAWSLRPASSMRGNGINIAVLDTGVDYNHPDLGGGFGRGHKVVDGYDYVNNRSRPMDDEGHGTHVAGVIAGDGDFQGVAPQANILAYKVLDERGEGSTDDILAALEDIVTDKRRGSANAADVINMSFGSRQNYVGTLIADALESAAEEGISVVMAGGNKGPDDNTLDFPDHFPNQGDSIITVGASGSGAMEVDISASGISGYLSGELMLYSPAPNFEGSAQVEAIEGGSDYRDFVDNSGNSKVESKVVLLERGDGTYREMAENAKKAGAEALLMYNNNNGMFYGSLVEPGEYVPTISISRQTGQQIESSLEQGNAWVSMSNDSRMADFSSRGPSSEQKIKPDMVAPGKNVMSTWTNGDYSWSEGTSVSAAFVSGSVALMRQANPDWSPAKIKSALMNTASPLTDYVNRVYSPTTQGAGELRTYQALTMDTIVEPGTLNFDAINYFGYQYRENEDLVINNDSERNRRYRASVNFYNNHQDLLMEPDQSSFTVDAGDSYELGMDLTAYTHALPPDKYQGYVEIEDVTGGNTYSVPFLVIMEERELDQDVDLGVSPFAVSDYQDSTMNVAIAEPMDRLEIDLYDENNDWVDTLHTRSTTAYAGTHSYHWDGKDSQGNKVDEGIYYLQVSSLPRGKADTEDNWITITRKTAVDRSSPEIALDGEEFQDAFASRGEHVVHVNDSDHLLKGNISDLSLEVDYRAIDLNISGEDVPVEQDGSFSHRVELGDERKQLLIEAEDWAGNTTAIQLELVYDQDGIRVKLHERELNLKQPPIVEDGRVLVPIDDIISSLLGGRVIYSDEDEDYAKIYRAGNDLTLYHGEKVAHSDEESVELQAAPRMVQGSMMVPLRDIADCLGLEIEWKKDDQAVYLEDTATETSYRHQFGGRQVNLSSADVPLTVITGKRFMLGRFIQDTFDMEENPARHGLYFSPTVQTFLQTREELIQEASQWN